LLPRLSKRGGLRGTVLRAGAASRQRDLAGLLPQAGVPFGQQDVQAILTLKEQRQDRAQPWIALLPIRIQRVVATAGKSRRELHAGHMLPPGVTGEAFSQLVEVEFSQRSYGRTLAPASGCLRNGRTLSQVLGSPAGGEHIILVHQAGTGHRVDGRIDDRVDDSLQLGRGRYAELL